ncbi:methylenetetrahydrofolate reductase [Aeromicrobium sp.]|uniref:methylenetetrahydrofolate reductase n=1 Tax=Aeromicrobium sp. TaxID=1871063 RepID=UPI003C683BF3
MRNKSEIKHALVGLLQHARYEVLPTPSTEDKVLAHVPVDRTVTITASPSKGLDVTFDLAERLGKAGYIAVPHIAARMVSDRAELQEICARLTAAGITTVFIPGGDAETVGSYPDALALLEDLREIGSPFPNVGITGYPESHPSINDDLTIQAMWDKRRHATHIVSNLTFDPKVFAAWLARMRTRGVTLPLLVGLPGPIDRTKLLGMATKIGVGESTKFLAKNKRLFAGLAAPGGFTGERFLEQVAAAVSPPSAIVEGLHVFTFNQIAETEAWRTSMIERLSH